jgi:tetratricopeptide (TPR) repeat protein
VHAAPVRLNSPAVRLRVRRSGARGCLLGLLLAAVHVAPAAAQGAAHPSCDKTNPAASVTAAKAALERQPDRVEMRLKLADALVDQNCYEEAIAVLERGRSMHPQSAELENRLHELHSEVAEQSYIQNLTQAEESALQQRNQLRCTKLADLAACNAALATAPDDLTLLQAKADALLQSGHAADAVAVYQHAARLSPANDALKAKLADAQAQALHSVAPPPASGAAAAVSAAVLPLPPRPVPIAKRPAAAPAAAHTGSLASNTGASPAATPSYSNDAPLGRSN